MLTNGCSIDMDQESDLHLLEVVSAAQHKILRSSGRYKVVGDAILTRTLPDGRMEMVFTKSEHAKWQALEAGVEAECLAVDGNLEFGTLMGGNVSLPVEEPPTATQPQPIGDPVPPLPEPCVPECDKQVWLKHNPPEGPNHPPSSRPRESRGGGTIDFSGLF
jgi:hypothetical protein